MHDNQDWLYSILFDRTVLKDSKAKHIYDLVLHLLQLLMGNQSGARFGIDRRNNRRISVDSNQGQLVPNIFQLSSGESSLLNLVLSILREFDWTRTTFTQADHVRGIVVVDEADLHLHAVHQHEILPSLIHMFPRVQFILTTHSPLFVLGMRQVFGEEGFALYQLPQGDQIDPEDFSEFGSAYETLVATSRFSADVRSTVRDAQCPIVYLEGDTDLQYLAKAAELLGKTSMLEDIDVKDGNGDALNTAWKHIRNAPPESVPRTVIIIRDCEYPDGPAERDHRFRRIIPMQQNHPIQKGIENFFGQRTLEKARAYKSAFIDITESHQVTERGQQKTVPERWTVNEDEKTNLCNWLCENGTAEDFQYFQVIFDLLEELLPTGQVT